MFQYFLNKVRDHVYVRMSPETNPIIMATLKYMLDLDDGSWYLNDYLAPKLASPRFPYDLLFAIGGWYNGVPISTIETYDNRAQLWTPAIGLTYRNVPRTYHGATVINHKIYCIGGYLATTSHNSCKVFDALTKTWSEVCNKIITIWLGKCSSFQFSNGSNVFFR